MNKELQKHIQWFVKDTGFKAVIQLVKPHSKTVGFYSLGENSTDAISKLIRGFNFDSEGFHPRNVIDLSVSMKEIL